MLSFSKLLDEIKDLEQAKKFSVKQLMKSQILQLHKQGQDKAHIRKLSQQQFNRLKLSQFRFSTSTQAPPTAAPEAPPVEQYRDVTKNLMQEVDQILVEHGKPKKQFPDTKPGESPTPAPSVDALVQKQAEAIQVTKEQDKKEKAEQKKQEQQEQQKAEAKAQEQEGDKPKDCNQFCEKLKNLDKSAKENAAAAADANLGADSKENPSPAAPKKEQPEGADPEQEKQNIELDDVYKSDNTPPEQLTAVKADPSIIPPGEPSKLSPEEKNSSLKTIPVAKLPEALPKFSLDEDMVLFPGEQQGVEDFPCWEYKNKQLESKGKSCSIQFSMTVISLDGNKLDKRLGIKDLYLSCKIDNQSSVCDCSKYAELNKDFFQTAESSKFDITIPNTIVLENRQGAAQILRLGTTFEASAIKTFTLYMFAKNSSRTLSFKSSVPNGTIIVDNNAGALIVKQQNKDGTEQVDNISTSSFEEVTLIAGEPKVSLAQEELKPGASEPTKNHMVLELPLSGEGSRSILPHSDPFWQAHEVFSAIDSSINIQFYQYLNTSSKFFLSGISDLDEHFNNPVSQVNIVQRSPLETLKALDNNMTAIGCMDRYNMLTQFAQDQSFGNPFIFDELLQLYIVKGVFVNPNPSFTTIELTNKIKLFDFEAIQKAGISVTIPDRKVTTALRGRWMWQVKERICDGGAHITLDDYKALMKFSLQHWDLLTNDKQAKFMKIDELKVPEVHSPDTSAVETELNLLHVKNLIIREGLLLNSPDKVLVDAWNDMTNKYPSSIIQTTYEFCGNQALINDNILAAQWKGLEFLPDLHKLCNLMREETDKTDMRNLQSLPDSPLGEFEGAAQQFPTLATNIHAVLEQLGPDQAGAAVEGAIGHMDQQWAMTQYLQQARKGQIDQNAVDNQMDKVVDIANSDPDIKKLMSGEIPCETLEPFIKDFCNKLKGEVSKVPFAEDVAAMTNRLVGKQPDPDTPNPNAMPFAGDGINATGGNVQMGQGKANTNTGPGSGSESVGTPSEGYVEAIKSLPKDEIIATVTKLLQSDDISAKITKIWLKALFSVQGMTEEVANKLLNGLDNKPSMANLERMLDSDINSTQSPILKQKAMDVLEDFEQNVLKDALAIALKNQDFQESMQNQDPEVFNKLNDIKNGDEFKKRLPSLAELKKHPERVKKFNVQNTPALFKLVRKDMQRGRKDKENKPNKSLSDLGHLDPEIMNSEIAAKLQNKPDSDKTTNEKQTEVVLASTGSEHDKLDSILKIEPANEEILDVIEEQLDNLEPTQLALDQLEVLSENPNLVDAFVEATLAEKMKLSAEEMRKQLKAGADSQKNAAKIAVLMGCEEADSFSPEQASKMVAAVAQGTQSNDITQVLQNAEISDSDKLKKMTKSNELRPILPEAVSEELKTHIDAMNDDQVEQAYKSACMNNDLLEELKKDEEFKAKLEKASQNQFENPSNAMAVSELGLNEDEKKQILYNANNASAEFAAEDNIACANNTSADTSSKAFSKLSKLQLKITDPADAQAFASIANNTMPDAQKITALMNNDQFNALDPQLMADVSNSTIAAASHEETEAIFAEMMADPDNVEIMLEANPSLNQRVKCHQDPTFCEKLWDEDGTEVPVETAVTKAQLKKLMSLEEVGDHAQRKGMPNIQVTNDDKTTIDSAPMETQRDMILKAGIRIFDRSIKEYDATLKKLEEEAQQAQDLQSAADNMNLDGQSNADLQAMLDWLKQNMSLLIDWILQQLVNEQAKQTQARYQDKWGKPINAATLAATAPNAPSMPADQIADDAASFKTEEDLQEFVRLPAGMKRALTQDTNVQNVLLKVRQVRELMYAVEFDEIIAKCIKFNFINGAAVNNIKMEQLNQFANLNKDEYLLKPGDTKNEVIEKLERLNSEVKNQTVKTDFTGNPDAALDFTHANLERMLNLQDVSDSATSLEFNQLDLRTIVAQILNQNDIILSKPVYVMQLRTKLRKVGGDVMQLDENNFTGVDSDLYMMIQRERGLVNMAFFAKFKQEYSVAMADLLGSITGANVMQDVNDLIGKFAEVTQSMTSLQGFLDSMVMYMPDANQVLQPELQLLVDVYDRFIDLCEGVTPLGDFWIMNKLVSMMSKEEKQKQPLRDEVLAAGVTIQRMRVNNVIFRSVELIKSIQEMLKGDRLDRNYERDLQWIFFMAQGDSFLDFLDFRNQRIRDAKAKASGKKEEDDDDDDDEPKSKKNGGNDRDKVGKKQDAVKLETR